MSTYTPNTMLKRSSYIVRRGEKALRLDYRSVAIIFDACVETGLAVIVLFKTHTMCSASIPLCNWMRPIERGQI